MDAKQKNDLLIELTRLLEKDLDEICDLAVEMIKEYKHFQFIGG